MRKIQKKQKTKQNLSKENRRLKYLKKKNEKKK